MRTVELWNIDRVASVERPRLHASAQPQWSLLYRVAGWAALLSALLIPVQVIVFLVWPPPLESGAHEWFALFRQNMWAGLVNLDALLVLDNLLLIPIILALYIVLHKSHASMTLLALAFGAVGIVMYLAMNPAVQVQSLATKYWAAASESEQLVYLAAAETLLVSWVGTAFHVGYWLGSLSGILFGIAVLASGALGRWVGILGVLANVVGLGLYIPVVGVYVSVFSVVFLEIWYILLGREFLLLGRHAVNK